MAEQISRLTYGVQNHTLLQGTWNQFSVIRGLGQRHTDYRSRINTLWVLKGNNSRNLRFLRFS